MIENAESRRDAHNPHDREAPVKRKSGDSGNELRKKLRANAGSNQKNAAMGIPMKSFT